MVGVAGLVISGLTGCDFFTKPLDFNEKTTPTEQEEQKQEEQQPEDQTVYVESLSLNMTKMDLLVGEDQDLVATILPENATNKEVTFKSLDESVATVTQEGIVHGVSSGSTNIICQSVENGGKFEICSVSVKNAVVPVESLVIGSNSLSVLKGSVTKLTASVLPENATNKNLVWRSTNEDVLTVDEEGNVTAVEIGNASIIVKSEDNPNADAIFNIEVAPVIIHVTGVELSQTALLLQENSEPVVLTAHVLPYDPDHPENEASNKSIIWTSTNAAVASVGSDGTVTPKSKGQTVIRATSAENDEFYAECTVDVQRKDIESLTLNETSLAFSIGSTNNSRQLVATVSPDDATYKEVRWSSTDTHVATVSDTGLVVAQNKGSAVIIATHIQSGLIASCLVTVVDASKLSIVGEVLESRNYQQYIANKATNPNEFADFADKTAVFEVGDDNPVNLMPSFEIEDDEHNIYDGSAWPYPFLINVEVKDKVLGEYTKATSADYRVVDAARCDIQFTQAAAEDENEYRVSVRADGYPNIEDPDYVTATYNVKVVDGYNVTNAFELSYLDTCSEVRYEKHISDDATWGHGVDKIFEIDYLTFKRQHGLDPNYTPKTLVIQNDLSLGVSNLPSTFFYDIEEANENNWSPAEKVKSIGSLKDYSYLYMKSINDDEHNLHAVDDFETALSGNYFTLDLSRIPLVKRTDGKETTNLDQTISHAKFFGASVGTFECRNLNFIGNANCARDESETYLAGGISGLDVRYFSPSLTVKNVLAHGFYQTFMNDEAAVPKNVEITLNIDDCKLTDNYQCFVYNFGGDVVANNSTFYGCGGPVIIQDHRIIGTYPSEQYDVCDTSTGQFTINGYCPSVEFNDCDIRNYVLGTEAWFKSFGITTMVGAIKGLSDAVYASNDSHLSFLFNSSREAVVGASLTDRLLNLIVVNKGVATRPTDSLPVDGKVRFTVGGNEVDMFNYMSPTSITAPTTEEVARFTAEATTYLSFRGININPGIPLFETHGGHAAFMQKNSNPPSDPFEVSPRLCNMEELAQCLQTIGANQTNPSVLTEEFAKINNSVPPTSFYSDNGHIALYYNGMMLIFESGHVA